MTNRDQTVFDRIAGLFKPKPEAVPSHELRIYMHAVEYSQLQAAVEALAPRVVLEWGSGGSTRALLEDFPCIETLVSVEHNQRWYERVRDKLDDPRLRLHLAPPAVEEPDLENDPETHGKWSQRCEDERWILEAYVDLPGSLGLTFDFVLVDGRARVHCLREGFRLLRPGGVLLLHDAQRCEYQVAVQSLGRAVFLTPFEQGQVCLVRKP